MALMEQQYGHVITKMFNDRNDDNTVKTKLMKESTELQSTVCLLDFGRVLFQ